MRKWLASGLLGTMMTMAMPAHALTFATDAVYRSSLAASRFTGVGGLGQIGASGNVGTQCTGALVSSNVVLTATHCIQSGAFGFSLATSADATATGAPASVFRVTSSMTLKSYLGTGSDTDMALLTLDREAFGFQTYDLYTGSDEVGKIITSVGAGLSGLMSEGVTLARTDLRLRAGKNRYDTTFTALGGGEDVLLLDNDNGQEDTDLFGRYLGIVDRGVYEDGELVETGLIYGDSGGPDFIDGKIAGVHSFAGSGSFLESADGNGCGPGSIDKVVGNRFGCTDGSFSDFAGSVRVSFYADAIRSYIVAAAVPEPKTWLTMVVGFGLIGGGLRRRRGAVVAAT